MPIIPKSSLNKKVGFKYLLDDKTNAIKIFEEKMCAKAGQSLELGPISPHFLMKRLKSNIY